MPPDGQDAAPQIPATPPEQPSSPPQVAGSPPQAPPAAGGSTLAGKFNSVEELEASYKALESKLGQQSAEISQLKAASSPPPDGTPQVPKTPELAPTTGVSDLVTQAGLDPGQIVQQWVQHGELTPTQYEKLHGKGITRAMADEYFTLQGNSARLQQMEARNAADRATALAGGQQQLQNLLAWAGGTLTETEKNDINVRLANPASAEGAVHELLGRHARAVGAPATGGTPLQEPGATNITPAAPSDRQSITDVMRKAAAGDPAAQQQFMRIPDDQLERTYL